MKYVNHLKPVEIATLKDGFRNAPDARFRIRCQAILLSNKAYKIDQISDIIDHHRNTIAIWIENWESKGICGLFSEKAPGSKPIYDERDRERLLQLVEEHPHQLKKVQSLLEQETGKSSCLDTLRQILKKSEIQF